MLVVIPCHTGDESQAIRLLLWIGELGRVSANAMLFCSNDCDVGSLMQAGQLAFSNIRHEVDAENIRCNWQSDDPGSRDPSGPNSVFRSVAWSIYMSKDKPSWLFMEPDSIPLTKDWYYALDKEYKSCGRVVMGDLVSTNSPHLSGVSIYPYNVPELFPGMIHNVRGAFDMGDAAKVLAAAHITPLIMDRWRSPSFTPETFAKIGPETVLFHADKSGSLIPLVRQKLGMKGGEAPCETAGHTASTAIAKSVSVSSGAAKFDPSSAPDIHSMHREFVVDRAVQKLTGPVVDIYLKTYPKDYELANYCLKSIAKFVTGYRRIVIEKPYDGKALVLPKELFDSIKIEVTQDRQPGYIDQQAKKLAAFKHTDSDYLLYVDSDCCFQRPFDVSEMFFEGMPKWQYTALKDARADQASAWVPVMEKFLGKPPQHEFMRRHPHILPRWLPEEMDKFCKYRHGVTLDEYIMAQGDPAKPLQLSFSEFNCAGFFAWEFFPERIFWVTDDMATPAPLVQGFTHGGEGQIRSHIADCIGILGTDEPVEHDFDLPKRHPEQPLTTEGALKVLVMESKISPLHKARLWKRITAALGMEKPVQGPKRKPGRPRKNSVPA